MVNSFVELLLRVFGVRRSAFAGAFDPIRAELFSVERLEQHASTLAAAQKVTDNPKTGRDHARRLRENSRVLFQAYRDIAEASRGAVPISPAAEWLLDNFHVVEEQIREIVDDLPPGFYRKLPKLADGHLEGHPRVFGLAWALIAHSDSRLEQVSLTRFVHAYQRVQPLTIGEIWAIAITLRITLVENLRRMAEQIVRRREDYEAAEALANRLLNTRDGKAVAEKLRLEGYGDGVFGNGDLPPAFIVQLHQRLRNEDPRNIPTLDWLDRKLAAQGTNAGEAMREDMQRQSAMNVTVRNIITSMRLISTIDWATFFESVSLVDAMLRDGSDFAQMDFVTRDSYRRSIEDLAERSDRSELDVTARALAAANRAKSSGNMDALALRLSDPGYYLVSRGRGPFERELDYGASVRQHVGRLAMGAGLNGYVSAIAIVGGIAIVLALLALSPTDPIALPWLALLALVPASDLAVSLVNWAVTNWFRPNLLAGLELRDGVPAHLRTIVVIPMLLTSEESVEEITDRLEVHYLASPDGELYFALLTDWTDSVTEHKEGDDSLLEHAAMGITRLNARYGAGALAQRFHLFHRKRQWNPAEGKWMGWERKRGKLHELNRLLRGAADTSYTAAKDQELTPPSGVRFVITLDADTRLPRGAARRLIGKMAHPLTAPIFDPALGRVVAGHGILQPRVTPSLPIGREGSLFQRVFSGPSGLDPYAFAVSDVYQDLFEEGSYTGKGIYDIDAFEAALHERIPENTVLSHDLLEGTFARAGLASDVEVVEEFPSRYDVAAARLHRWVRGDWQLLPWILGLRRTDGHPPVPPVGRWKMLDNLRRSLSAPAMLLALICGWFLPLRASTAWTIFILCVIVLPYFLPWISGVLPQRRGISKRSHLRGIGADLVLWLIQVAFQIVFLAHQAWVMVDAVIRTLFRLCRRKRLLEWTTAAQVGQVLRRDGRALFWQLGGSMAFGALVLGALYLENTEALPLAAPFVVLWMASPALARWASATPPPAGHLQVDTDDRESLRNVARRTWRFFERFITAQDHMLPPDNFQEEPKPIVAHRTSPTNLGFYLLSVVAAREFGWLGTLEALDRLQMTLGTMQRLERFRGHFLNWYDTSDLRALEPRYVSSVDSGNLCGHLIALANAARGIAQQPVLSTQWRDGIGDALRLTRETLGSDSNALRAVDRAQMSAALEAIDSLLAQTGNTPNEVALRLDSLSRYADTAAEIARNRGSRANVELGIWTQALADAVETHRRDFQALLPWAFQPIADAFTYDGDLKLWPDIPVIAELPERCDAAIDRLEKINGEEYQPLIDTLRRSARAARSLLDRLTATVQLAEANAEDMQFGFLYDRDRQLFSIGYRVDEDALDGNYYDLLASEARLTSLIAIAKGDVPARHWFHLGRTLTPIESGSALISWSGSMFEYLMPSLVMRAPVGSLLERTTYLAVKRQISYADGLDVPWGISESQYNARDLEFTYQYTGFGVPDLGYKRGLGENIVIAPYATGLAAMVDPSAAARNFARMADAGARGAYGWYEALDYTPARVPAGAQFALIRAYMAHHQAMTIVAIANALQNSVLRSYFHTEPMVQATELLLQERMPRDVPVARPPTERVPAGAKIEYPSGRTQRQFDTPHSAVPRTHLLSNGRYTVMVTSAGSGYSCWRDLDVTRWREDTTRDHWGSYIFLRDVQNGDVWSTAYQPTCKEPDSYLVSFAEGKAEFQRRDGTIRTTMEVAVSAEDDAEVRRVTLTNLGTRTREIEITSYAEMALARRSDDAAHPAFSKMFVETEFLTEMGALLATRRQRSSADPMVWAAHMAVLESGARRDPQYETDRSRFIGRGQSTRAPSAMLEGWPLSNTTGPVLDPVFSLRHRIVLPGGASAHIAFWTLTAPSREEVLDLIDKHRDANAFERATTLAWTQAQIQHRHIGIGSAEADMFQNLASHILYANARLRPKPDLLEQDGFSASTLWSLSISGDLPIVLMRISDPGDLEPVRELLRAQEYWHMHQLAVDVVILNERSASYTQDLQVTLEALARVHRARPKADGANPANVFVLRTDLLHEDARKTLFTAARVVLSARRGSLYEQIEALEGDDAAAPPPSRLPMRASPSLAAAAEDLEFFNGVGGFSGAGREYVTILRDNTFTPAPWLNVVANENFGFQISAEGAGYCWALNSQQNQITAWSNDPVATPVGEALYVRDEDSGAVWTPTALPIRDKTARYTVRHGQGYSRFENAAGGLTLELDCFVPIDDPIKISRLKITDTSGKPRRLSVTAYVEWVLGARRSLTAQHIVTEADPVTGALFARNPWSADFGTRIAFADLGGRQQSWSGDRAEFLGRNGAPDRPLALATNASLSNRTGAGLDPCAAQQTRLRLEANGTAELTFFLGQTASREEAQMLVVKYRATDLDAVRARATGFWDDLLGGVQVETPDPALDILVNRWLPYQALACRIWARAGYYQASGAYGFRDQLQDVMAFCVSKPEIARAHILRAAARQFPEGDVQHWWLPESGRGIRTRVSDDTVWLAYVVAHYIDVTGDAGILDEDVPFLDGPPLNADQHEAFFQPTISAQHASLYEHCARGLDQRTAAGAHSLPLIGSGDWNDGMNRVGEHGQGESVWLGWFLHAAINGFVPIATKRADYDRGAHWLLQMATLKEGLEGAWDGDWYRRAYFDDGTPLGSASNNECRIDSIAQSWSVLSGVGDKVRSERAMQALDKYLVRSGDCLALLFTPPFKDGALDPGYIKGYPPGMRENGGQYTHAAIWAAMAFASLGNGDKAGELLAMLNPIHHARNPAEVHRYKVEPYVMAADVYSVAPHVGRGGWTWYTGAAAWMYRAILESLLGLRVQGTEIVLNPCIPKHWPGFSINFRYRNARYDIRVENPNHMSRGIKTAELDGVAQPDGTSRFTLADDGKTHSIHILLG